MKLSEVLAKYGGIYLAGPNEKTLANNMTLLDREKIVNEIQALEEKAAKYELVAQLLQDYWRIDKDNHDAIAFKLGEMAGKASNWDMFERLPIETSFAHNKRRWSLSEYRLVPSERREGVQDIAKILMAEGNTPVEALRKYWEAKDAT